MNIVIKNGIIDKFSSFTIDDDKEIQAINQFEKKNYVNFDSSVPGPYYDFFNNHICIPRYSHQISNFYGPQDNKMIVFVDNTNLIQTNVKYCAICHQEIKPNPSFSSKRKVFVDDNTYTVNRSQVMSPISVITLNYAETLAAKMSQLEVTSLPSNASASTSTKRKYNKDEIWKKWKIINVYILLLYMKQSKDKYLKSRKRATENFYKLTYKVLKNPIHYEVSPFQSLLLWPWELTPYQKFKLDNPNYRDSPVFYRNKNLEITTNYVKIE